MHAPERRQIRQSLCKRGGRGKGQWSGRSGNHISSSGQARTRPNAVDMLTAFDLWLELDQLRTVLANLSGLMTFVQSTFGGSGGMRFLGDFPRPDPRLSPQSSFTAALARRKIVWSIPPSRRTSRSSSSLNLSRPSLNHLQFFFLWYNLSIPSLPIAAATSSAVLPSLSSCNGSHPNSTSLLNNLAL